MAESTMEEDDIALEEEFKNINKSQKDPNLVEDIVYRMRFEKEGIVWHSWVDPNRPESPPVEWPQYPKDERPSDISDDGILGHVTDPEVEAVLRKSSSQSMNPIEPIQSQDGGCAQYTPPMMDAQYTPMVEDPEKLDDIMDSVHMPTFPGLYSESGDPRIGRESYLHGHDANDDNGYDW